MKRDLTTGSVTRRVLSLSWPTAVAMSLQVGFNIGDAYFVGKIGPDAIAAVSMVFPVIFMMFALGAGIGVGTTSLVARSLGKRDGRTAADAAEQSFLLLGIITFCVTGGGLLLQDPIFRAMGAGADLLHLIFSYSTWIFAGSFFIFLFTAGAAILRGEGDMKTPMVGMGLSVILNLVLDPLLIFGVWVFPELGLSGAAVATVASRAVGCLIVLGYLFLGHSAVKLRFRNFRPHSGVIWRILRVGVPTSANQMMIAVGFMFLIRIVSGFGSDAVASYGLAIRLNQIAILPCLAVSTAVITLVGQNVGAGKLDRAASTAWRATGLAMLLMESVGVAFFVVPDFWMDIFTEDAAVIAHGASFLRITSLTLMFIGVGIVLGGAFQGAGRGLPALAVTTLRSLGLAVPGAWLLSRFFGLQGVWVAIAGATVISGAVSALWFRAGTWRRR